jgi:hypothetical protein
MEPEVQCRVHKSPTVDPILRQRTQSMTSALFTMYWRWQTAFISWSYKREEQIQQQSVSDHNVRILSSEVIQLSLVVFYLPL